MNSSPLVLSLFPGADLLGMAFELEGFCVVRGPDVLLGGDIRQWMSVPGKFDGVIGGPPCQAFSVANLSVGGAAGVTEGNLVPEFERIVLESGWPDCWFLMENVPQAPLPFEDQTDCEDVPIRVFDYEADAHEFGSAQHRPRRFCSDVLFDLEAQKVPVLKRHPDPWPCVTATEYKCSAGSNERTMRQRAGRKVGRKMTLGEVNVAMGLPEDWATPALTSAMSYKVRGNGVPLEMGCAVARAIREALYE